MPGIRASRRVAAIVALSLCVLARVPGGSPALHAASPDTAPPLPAPSGTVVHVSTEAQLQAAVAAISSGTTIVLAPGTYQLTSSLYINKAVTNIGIRGATNNRNDVVLAGPGMANANYGSVPYGLWTGGGVTGITVANLTIRDVYYHPLIFNGGTEQPRVYNVRLLDGGEQLLKANPDGAGGGVDGGVVEYSVFEYTTVARSDYTNGVDVHSGRDWVIRHNLFRRIRSAVGLAGPAVLMWNDARNTLVDANTFVDCHRDISLGLITRTPNDHTGGIVRNNMIVRTAGAGGDVGIAVFDSPGTVVVHNSIWLGGAYPNAIEYRFADTTGTVIANNLTDSAITARDGATATLAGNVTTATAAYFAGIGSGDLHLTSSATLALDRVAAHASSGVDWDGETRPAGALADVGADERVVAPPPPVEICGNGIDDDGDGLIDEGCPPPPPPPVEICGNGIDDDHDGLIDEGCPPPPPPPVEICGNGIDDDHDGLIDEGCPPPPPPPVEICGNGIDDDHDGLIDEGCPPPPPPSVEICGNGIDDDGDGLIDENCTATPVAPGAPTRLTAHVRGRTVALAWLAPIAGGQVDQYVLDAGLTTGATFVQVPLGSRTEAALPNVGAGTFFLRVRATGPGGTSAASNEIAVTVGTCAATATPRDLTAHVNGTRLTLSWRDDTPCEGRPYRLIVGSRAGGADLGVVPVTESPFEAMVPPGTYFIRVAGASGAPSNEVRVAPAGACVAPSFTIALSGRTVNGQVDLQWAPADGAIATSADAASPVTYLLEAGLTPSGSEIGTLPMGRTTHFATPAPAGRYYLRIRAANACGVGPASNDVVVTVP